MHPGCRSSIGDAFINLGGSYEAVQPHLGEWTGKAQVEGIQALKYGTKMVKRKQQCATYTVVQKNTQQLLIWSFELGSFLCE